MASEVDSHLEPTDATAGRRIVRVWESFDSMSASCRDLFAAAERRNGLFFSIDWFKNLERTALAAQGSPRIYSLEDVDTGEAVLALPMLANVSGSRLSAYGNYYTCLFGPIQSGIRTIGPADWQLLVSHMASEKPRWDIIDLHPLDIGAQSFNALCDALRHAGMAVQPYFCFGNWYLDAIGCTFAQYFELLPGKVRNTIRRKSAHVEKAANIRICILQGIEDVEEATRAFTAVYAASWKSAEPFQEFMPGLICLCAAKGWLRMGIAYQEQMPIAAQLWIVSAGVASIYKLAYDESYAHLSIGSILTARMFQHVIDVDKVREVDYLTGDELYKKDWTPVRRERWGIVACNLRTVRGALAAARNSAFAIARRVFRRSP